MLAKALALLANMLDAGLSLQQALQGPAVASLAPRLAASLRAAAVANRPLSDALAPLGVLDAASIALLRAGERSGNVPRTLRRVAEGLERRAMLARRLRAMLAYPVAVVVVGILVLPLSALVQSGAGAYLARALPPVLLLSAFVFGVLIWLPRLPPGAPPRRMLMQLGHALPPVRGILWHRALGSFADVLGSSLGAGLSARESLELAARATPHPRFTDAGPAMVARIDRGGTLADALSVSSPPPEFTAQVAAAELAGTLEGTLARLATQFDASAQQATTSAIRVLGAVAFASVAAYGAWSMVRTYGATMERREAEMNQLLRQ